jgi:hypothetical protein
LIPEVLVAENTFNDDGKKNIVYAVPPKPISEMTKEETFEMADQLFDAINAKDKTRGTGG